MNILFIILIVIIVLIGWLLLAPIQLIIKSEESLLKFSIVSIGYATIVLEDDEFSLSFRIAFFSRRLSLNELMKKRKSKDDHKKGDKKEFEEEPKRKKKKSRIISKKRRKWLLRLFRIPRSFKVKELFVNIDTGDYILNGYLFPVFGLINYYRPEWSCSINYYGRNQVSLFLQSSLLRMIYVFLK